MRKAIWLGLFLFGALMNLNSQISPFARVDHINPALKDSIGNIMIEVSNGTAPYSFSWLEGLYPLNKDRINCMKGTYNLRVKDAAGDSVFRSFAIGYKANWSELNKTKLSGDSLQVYGSGVGYPTAITRSILRGNTIGWGEFVYSDIQNPFVVGFIDSSEASSLGYHYDIDFGIHVTYGNTLYAWYSGNFFYINNIEDGDVLRFGKSDSTLYIVHNGLTVFEVPYSLSKDLKVKALISGDPLCNVGLSFADSNSLMPIRVIPIIGHQALNGIDTSGTVKLDISGGQTPYSVTWNPEIGNSYEVNQVPTGSYEVTTEDNAASSFFSKFKLGFKVNWSELNDSEARNDTLFPITTGGTIYPTALSSNYLKTTSSGWVQHIARDIDGYIVCGLLDSAYTPFGHLDIDFGIHLTPDEGLYAYESGTFTFLGTINPGDAIEFGRYEGAYTIKLNGSEIYISSYTTNKPLRIKSLVFNCNIINLGCSFGSKLEAELYKVNISSPEDSNSGYAEVKAKYGNPPYAFRWSNGAEENFISGLTSGQYKVVIKDQDDDSLELSVNIGNICSVLNLKNTVYSEDGFTKVTPMESSFATLDSPILPNEDGLYSFDVDDQYSRFSFVLRPIDSLTNFARDYSYAVEITTVSILRAELPSSNSSEYSTIDFADTVTTGTYANILLKRFVYDTCHTCITQNVNGVLYNYGNVYYIADGSSIKKGYKVGANSSIKLEIRSGDFKGYLNDTLRLSDAISTNKYYIGEYSIFSSKAKVLNIIKDDNTMKETANECYTCLNDVNRNWIEVTTYNDHGIKIASGRTYSDALGRARQTQMMNFSTGKILATQIIYDAYGRNIASTLPAPIEQNCFCYKQGFVTNSSNSEYSYADFDMPNYYTNNTILTSGERDLPKALGNTISGTLGWYYSNNNTLEKYVAAASTPYNRIQYNTVDPSSILKTSKAGEKLNSGSGHEVYSFKMATMGELNHIFGPGLGWRVDEFTNFYETSACADIIRAVPLENTAPLSLKQIVRDENGVENISFYDLTGNQIATCLSGKVNGSNVKTQTVMTWLSFENEEKRYVDIHLPDGCENSLAISYPGGYPGTPQTIFNVIDLKTGEYVKFSGSINFTGSSPNLQPGYYRIRVVSFPTGQTGVNIIQNLNYYNFSLYYYDYANRLKAAVPPNGFDQNYAFSSEPSFANTERSIRTITSNANFPENFAEGRTWSLDSTFENTVPLELTTITENEALNVGLKIAFGNNYGNLIGEVPGESSSDERTMEYTTARSNYFSQVFSSGSNTMEVMPDTIPLNYKTIRFKIKLAITDDRDSIIENTIQESTDLVCTIHYNDTLQYTSWASAFFTYNQAYNNESDTILVPSWENLKVLEFYPISLELGDSLQLYEGLTNQVKLTVSKFTIKRNSKPTHKMVERHRYDSWSQLLTTVSPDEGKLDAIYSEDGKIRFTQNSRQDETNASASYRHFTFMDYDAYSRPTKSGVFVPPGGGMNSSLVGNVPRYYYFESYDEKTSPLNINSIHNLTEAILTYPSSSGFNYPNWLSNSKEVVNMVYDTYDPGFYTETGGLSNITYVQKHLTGKISYTYNRYKKTWYSYDEKGNVAWVVQKYYDINVTGPNKDVVKTFRYTYDASNNLTELVYNSESPTDRFYHHYEYDQSSRLKRSFTSRNGTNKTLNATYTYYQHGPLKKVVLAKNLQAIDYVYTINGWLKSMNSAEMDAEHDPGLDGYTNSSPTNTNYKDIFGMNLEYFYQDYKRMGTNIQSFYDDPNVYEFAPDQFNGIIKGQRWQTKTPLSYSGLTYPNQHLMMGYLYDKKYQLVESKFGEIGSNGSENVVSPGCGICYMQVSITNDYKVHGITYDYNGNLLSLKRTAYQSSSGGLNMDDLAYAYASCSNKLTKTTDAIGQNNYSTLGFKPGQGNNNYQYNTMGELTQDSNEDKKYYYNAGGNIEMITTVAGAPIARYAYDEGGMRILKAEYLSGNSIRFTWYVRDAGGNIVATYNKLSSYQTIGTDISDDLIDNNSFALPSEWNVYSGGRIGILDNTGGVENYIYELSDHLGNVRATFKPQIKTSITNNFNSNVTNDDNWFNNTNSTLTNSFDINDNLTHNFMVRVQWPTTAIGAGSKCIPVVNGDNFTIGWKSLFETGSLPNAGLRIRMTDENGNLLPVTGANLYIPISGSANSWQSYQLNMSTNSSLPLGYTYYITFYPESNDAGKVIFFDDYSFTFNTGGVTAPEMLNVADYYPHGSVMPGRNYSTSFAYKYGYQGQFAEKDAETNENFFELRNYDPLLGRFKTIDLYGQYWSPYLAMGNTHPNQIDPDGGFSYGGAIIGAAIGAGVGMVGSIVAETAGNHELATKFIDATPYLMVMGGFIGGGFGEMSIETTDILRKSFFLSLQAGGMAISSGAPYNGGPNGHGYSTVTGNNNGSVSRMVNQLTASGRRSPITSQTWMNQMARNGYSFLSATIDGASALGSDMGNTFTYSFFESDNLFLTLSPPNAINGVRQVQTGNFSPIDVAPNTRLRISIQRTNLGEPNFDACTAANIRVTIRLNRLSTIRYRTFYGAKLWRIRG